MGKLPLLTAVGVVSLLVNWGSPTWAQTTVADRRVDAEPIIREAASRRGVSGDRLVAIVECETGHTWDPYVVGRQREQGPFQLLPGTGNGLSTFYSWGYSDPHDWAESADFAALMIARGRGGEWHC